MMQPDPRASGTPASSPETMILRLLTTSLGQRRFEQWFSKQTRLRVIGQHVVVEAPNAFVQKWMQQSLRQEIWNAATMVLGDNPQLDFVVGAKPATEVFQDLPSESIPRTPSQTTSEGHLVSLVSTVREDSVGLVSVAGESRRSQSMLRIAQECESDGEDLPVHVSAPEIPKAVRRLAQWSEFIPGRCNEFALVAVQQLLRPEGQAPSSLFLHGPIGVGKTHLLEGLYGRLRALHPKKQIVLLTAEQFANAFTEALRQHKLPSFRQRFRHIEVLIVDDFDFFDAKRGIQEEFLHTIQQLERQGGVVVAAAHSHPRLMSKLSEELQTRLLAGIVGRIDPPELETRRRIVEHKAREMKCEVTPEALDYIAEKFRKNVRELEGALHTVRAWQVMTGKRIGITAARQALSDLERDCVKVVRLPEIEAVVCGFFGIEPTDLRSEKRQRSFAQPRMLAMYLARKLTQAAYSEIGTYFGGRNHTTVMSAEKKVHCSLADGSAWKIQARSWTLPDLVETLERQLLAG